MLKGSGSKTHNFLVDDKKATSSGRIGCEIPDSMIYGLPLNGNECMRVTTSSQSSLFSRLRISRSKISTSISPVCLSTFCKSSSFSCDKFPFSLFACTIASFFFSKRAFTSNFRVSNESCCFAWTSWKLVLRSQTNTKLVSHKIHGVRNNMRSKFIYISAIQNVQQYFFAFWNEIGVFESIESAKNSVRLDKKETISIKIFLESIGE